MNSEATVSQTLLPTIHEATLTSTLASQARQIVRAVCRSGCSGLAPYFRSSEKSSGGTQGLISDHHARRLVSHVRLRGNDKFGVQRRQSHLKPRNYICGKGREQDAGMTGIFSREITGKSLAQQHWERSKLMSPNLFNSIFCPSLVCLPIVSLVKVVANDRHSRQRSLSCLQQTSIRRPRV